MSSLIFYVCNSNMLIKFEVNVGGEGKIRENHLRRKFAILYNIIHRDMHYKKNLLIWTINKLCY